MSEKQDETDLHFPNWGSINPLRYLSENNRRYNVYFDPGQTVAGIGCGPGFYTLALAEHVGDTGLVYSIDSNDRAINSLRKRAKRKC